MEVSESKEKLLVFFRLGAAIIFFGGDLIESTLKVSLETLGRLICDLNTALEDRDWEVPARHGCQPKTILGVHCILILSFLDLFKLRHPRS